MASVTIECYSLQDIIDAWNDGWIGCHLDKQTMKAVVEIIASQQPLTPDAANGDGIACPICGEKNYCIHRDN